MIESQLNEETMIGNQSTRDTIKVSKHLKELSIEVIKSIDLKDILRIQLNWETITESQRFQRNPNQATNKI